MNRKHKTLAEMVLVQIHQILPFWILTENSALRVHFFFRCYTNKFLWSRALVEFIWKHKIYTLRPQTTLVDKVHAHSPYSMKSARRPLKSQLKSLFFHTLWYGSTLGVGCTVWPTLTTKITSTELLEYLLKRF